MAVSICPIPPGSRIVHLFVSPGHNYVGHFGREPGCHPMLELAEVSCVAGHGLVGDRYFRNDPSAKGQITFFAEEVFAALRSALPEAGLSPAAARRNVVTSGVDLNELIDEEFVIQGVRFQGVEECRPCDWMNRAYCAGARDVLAGRGGLRARILSDGILRVGGTTGTDAVVNCLTKVNSADRNRWYVGAGTSVNP